MSKLNLLDGYTDIEPFAIEVGRDPRTVRRWMDLPDGLPYARIGNRRLIHIETAREWIFSRMRVRNPRRARTQPKERAAPRHARKQPKGRAAAAHP
jgi:hypothetical protein